MGSDREATLVLADLWEFIDAQQWDQMLKVIDPGAQIRYVHTGELLDAAGFVRLNKDYPGTWRVSVEDVIGAGDRAVSRTYVTDGNEGHWVASFATTRAGQITELVEVWTRAGQLPPPSRPAT